MKILAIILALVVVILICDRYESRLPTPIKQLYHLWQKFSHLLGVVMSTIILTIFWIIGIGTYGIGLRLIALLNPAKPKTSYWIESPKHPVRQMKHQF